MKILDRYIAGVVVTATGIALLVVVGLDAFFEVIREIDNVGKGSYTMGKMLQYVALTLPHNMYELFPVATLLGSLMGMGTLATNSELIAMRAAGLSVWRIVRSVLQVGVLLLLAAVIVGEVVAPVAQQYGQQLRLTATNRTVSFLGSHGLWVRDDEYFINARNVLAEDKLADVTVYEVDEARRLSQVTRAKKALYRKGKWVLTGVHQTQFDGDAIRTSQSRKRVWDSLLTPELLSIVALKPQTMSVHDIHQFSKYLEDNGLDSLQYRYAFWERLMTPLAALVMLFISVPFVFAGMRSVSAGRRLFLGILIGFGFYLISQVTTQMGQVYGLHPLIATIIPNLVFIAAGVYAVQRV
ncbi:MAG: LPS export ABC transporter permease LptG [Gammaproteobacteria bacterium]